MDVHVTSAQRAQLVEIARRLGLQNPKNPGSPSVTALVRRLADRYEAEPEPAIGLLAQALDIAEVAQRNA